MKAVARTRYLPPNFPQSLEDVILPIPEISGRDLLIQVKAISVNPVDTKVRTPNPKQADQPRILGWDASGIVQAIGPEVSLFKVGDEVFYAGDITRQGSNAEFQLVDERIVGHKPRSIGFAESAAMPLTAITAWEALFEQMSIDPEGANRRQSLLIIGGAGGVGSIAIQLAKIAGLVVISTASRPLSKEWVEAMGADFVVNHREPLAPQLSALGFSHVDFIANFNNTGSYWTQMAELIRPLGHIVAIVDSGEVVDLNLLKSKSVRFSWEFMFTRAMYQTPDMHKQGEILNTLANWIDAQKIHSTLAEIMSPICADNLRQAHEKLESGLSIGKIVLEKF